MKTKVYALLGLIAIAFIAFSCKKNNAEEATLEVSKSEIKFAKAASEEIITVTASAEKWIASSPVEGQWLTLVKEGTNLKVKADANEKGVSRRSYVLINAGGAAERIEVVQSAADVVIATNPTEIKVKPEGGETVVELETNVADLKVFVEENESKWLAVNYSKGRSMLTITVQANEGKERVGKIYMTSGKTTQELSVKQMGQPVYILPFIAKETPVITVDPFERQRGSVLVNIPGTLGPGYSSNNLRDYSIQNKNFTSVAYQYGSLDAQNYLLAMSVTPKLDLIKDAKAVDAFMAEQGFKKEAEKTYVHSEYPYMVTAVIEAKVAGFIVKYRPSQPKDYPTFKELPLKNAFPWVLNEKRKEHGKKFDTVDAWEQQNGGKIKTQNGEVSAIYDVTGQEDIVARVYFFRANKKDAKPSDKGYIDPKDPFYGECRHLRVVYTKTDLAFFEAGGKYFLTKEFLEMMKKEGFVTAGDNDGFSWFAHKDGRMLGLRVVAFSDINAGQNSLDILGYKDDTSEFFTSAFNLKGKAQRLAEIKDML